MQSESPKTIFKYQPINSQTMIGLLNDQLYFSDPGHFNDPFECKPALIIDSKKSTLQKILAHLVSERVKKETLQALDNANVKGEKAAQHSMQTGKNAATEIIQDLQYSANNPFWEIPPEEAELHLLSNTIRKELLQRYDRGICCFTDLFDHPLMWSHYANQHQGICVGYTLDRQPEPSIFPVQYGGDRTIKSSLIEDALIKKDPQAQHYLDQQILFRKAPEWHYEKEWRLLGPRGRHFSTLKLSEIIFGLRCSMSMKYTFFSLLENRSPKIDFYEMIENQKSFDLNRQELDTTDFHNFPHVARSATEVFGPPKPPS